MSQEKAANNLPAVRAPGGLRSGIYAFSKIFVWLFMKTLFRASVSGREKLPANGPCLILANHQSYLDPPLVGALVGREIHYLARLGVADAPLLGQIFSLYNAHGIRRGGVDREAIKTCVAILRAGWPLLLFPEGTRSKGGRTAQPKGGFAMILEHLPETPCVPVFIDGSHRALGRAMVIPRPVKIRLLVGEAFTLEARGEDEPRREYYDRCAARVEEAWRKLGAYGD